MNMRSRFIIMFTATALLSSNVCTTVSAADMAAVVYANRYAESYNESYPTFDSDCTNFVSQCVYAGGEAMVGSGTGVPSVVKKVYVESYNSSNPEWYVSEKIERTVGFDYWRCSSSWSQTSDFRYYFTQDDDASVTTFSVDTTAKWNTVLSQLQLGDVVQAGITGNGHSVIITSVYNSANGVRYCGHTIDVAAEPISSFKSWMETKGFTTITVIHT